jgi:hypothetical protein
MPDGEYDDRGYMLCETRRAGQLRVTRELYVVLQPGSSHNPRDQCAAFIIHIYSYTTQIGSADSPEYIVHDNAPFLGGL